MGSADINRPVCVGLNCIRRSQFLVSGAALFYFLDEGGIVYFHAGAHSGANEDAFNVFSFGGGWFGLYDAAKECQQIIAELLAIERAFAYGGVDIAGFIYSELYFTGFEFLHGFGYIHGNGAYFGVWHESSWAEYSAEFTYFAHHVGGGDYYVYVGSSGFYFFDKFF